MSPAEIGGFKSEKYLSISPQGKVPALECTTSSLRISESDTVSRYLLSTYANQGPSFQPDNPKSNMIARFHDLYLTSIQACLYKPTPPFGIIGSRKHALAEYAKQLNIIAGLIEDEGMYLCGAEVSLADATLFPSIVFASYMFPKFDSGIEKPIPEKIETWYNDMIEKDATFKKIYDEVSLFRLTTSALTCSFGFLTKIS
jgi:glutathione S-transferase